MKDTLLGEFHSTALTICSITHNRQKISPQANIPCPYRVRFQKAAGLVGLFRTYQNGSEAIDSLIAAPHLIGVAGFVGIDREAPPTMQAMPVPSHLSYTARRTARPYGT